MESAELLKKIRKIELKTKGLTKHIFSGQYHSAFKGRGMTFSEVRDYHFGDEIKTIDWNVTARFNEPFVKVFEEERELTVLLLIDVSGSLNFGSTGRTKRELALEIAAILSFSALSNNDKVGAIMFTDKVEKYISPDKGRKHILKILREFIELKPTSTGTSVINALKFLRNTQKKKAITFVISDFVSEESMMEAFNITARKHDIVALQTIDPLEANLPSLGFIEFEHAETGKKTWVNSSDKRVKEEFKNKHEDRIKSISNDFKRSGLDHSILSTDEDIIRPLIQLFKHRR